MAVTPPRFVPRTAGPRAARFLAWRRLGWLEASCGTRVASGGSGSVDDFDIAQSKIGESAQRVVDRAIEESRRAGHPMLTNEHIFLAFPQVEWDTFSQVMRDLELNPHEILQALEQHLQVLPT